MQQWTKGIQICFCELVFLFSPDKYQNETAGSHGRSLFNFFGGPPYCFPQWLCRFTFPPTAYTAICDKSATICMNPEVVMLSEVSQAEKDKYHRVSVTCISYKLVYKTDSWGTFLVVKTPRSQCRRPGSVPGRETKVPQATAKSTHCNYSACTLKI